MKCVYCDTCSEHLLATCQTCQEHFCNNESQPTSLSHILRHIKDTKHNSFSFPDKGIVQCSQCDRKNITTLYQDIDSSLLCIEHKNDECKPIVIGKKVLYLLPQPQHPDVSSVQKVDQEVVESAVVHNQQDNPTSDPQQEQVSNIPDQETENINKIINAESTISDILMQIILVKDLLDQKQFEQSKVLLNEMDDMLESVCSIIDINSQDQMQIDLQAKIDDIKPVLQSCHKQYDASLPIGQNIISKADQLILLSQDENKEDTNQMTHANSIIDNLLQTLIWVKSSLDKKEKAECQKSIQQVDQMILQLSNIVDNIKNPHLQQDLQFKIDKYQWYVNESHQRYKNTNFTKKSSKLATQYAKQNIQRNRQANQRIVDKQTKIDSQNKCFNALNKIEKDISNFFEMSELERQQIIFKFMLEICAASTAVEPLAQSIAHYTPSLPNRLKQVNSAKHKLNDEQDRISLYLKRKIIEGEEMDQITLYNMQKYSQYLEK